MKPSGDEGQHDDREGEDHRQEVDDVGAHDVRSRHDVAQSGTKRRHIAFAGHGRGGRSQREKQNQRERERHQVRQVDRTGTEFDGRESPSARPMIDAVVLRMFASADADRCRSCGTNI